MKRRDRLDGIDAQHVGETLDTRGWRLIDARIRKTVDGKMRDLVRPSDQVATAHLRGFIEGLELALKVPDILIREGRGDKANDATEKEVT